MQSIICFVGWLDVLTVQCDDNDENSRVYMHNQMRFLCERISLSCFSCASSLRVGMREGETTNSCGSFSATRNTHSVKMTFKVLRRKLFVVKLKHFIERLALNVMKPSRLTHLKYHEREKLGSLMR